MPMSKNEAKTVQDRAKAALEREFGPGTVRPAGGSIGDTLTLKFDITPGGAEERETAAKANFARAAALVGLQPSDFGRGFMHKSTLFTICGINLQKPKFCISAKNTDGKEYGFPAEQVKSALDRFKVLAGA